MKKLIITTTILLGISLSTFADGGLFQRGYNAENGQSGYTYFNSKDPVRENAATPMLPSHGSNENEAAPLGSGIAMLMGLGAAYWMTEKRKKR